jgi:hypothetical protein
VDLPAELATVLDAVAGGRDRLDALARTPAEADAAMVALAELELRGLVRRAPGRALRGRRRRLPFARMTGSRRPPVCLTIAGSDSGGGAGIQADLKAFAACGTHGTSAITALTAQNTVAVVGVQPVPGPFIVEQVRAVVSDLGVDAVKIGMLGSVATIEAVEEALELLPAGVPVVLDPSWSPSPAPACWTRRRRRRWPPGSSRGPPW